MGYPAQILAYHILIRGTEIKINVSAQLHSGQDYFWKEIAKADRIR